MLFVVTSQGPAFFLCTGTTVNEAFPPEFLERHGAAKYSCVVMTPNGFLTDEAWRIIVPKLIAGLRKVVEDRAYVFWLGYHAPVPIQPLT